MTAKTFRDLGVADALCDALEAQGITHPFPIQELALPLALGGNDLIGQARTGTGKTLAFGLPLLQRLDPSRNTTQALVVVPTRELCVQVHEDLKVGASLGLTTISVYGGTPYEAQIEALTTGVQVVVGTPGRLLDHLNRGNLDLSEVRTLVLDEADEMLDMGFLPDVERLIEGCNPERHSMLFSATMPTAIVKLARRYMSHPTFTRADTEQHETAPNVEQHFFTVHRMDKPRVLARILQSPNRGGAYVFVRTKHMADRLVDELEGLAIPAVAVHGDLRQQTREKNLDRFRDGRADVLVCTEVAARGIDVAGVTHVINYDCPDDEKMYLHRIGRTARAGQAGVAVTFAEFNEVDRLNVIRKAVGATDTETKQIFSTSDELTELFDLPAERPWDHLAERGGSGGRGGDAKGGAKSKGGGKGKGDRGRRDSPKSGGSDAPSSKTDTKSGDRKREGRDDRPKGKSDGRSKSRRSAETGGASPGSARRREERPSSRETTPEPESTPASKPQERTAATSSSDDASRTRTRTRTRSRGGSPSRDRASDAGDGERASQSRRQRSPRREHTSSSGRDRRETRESDTGRAAEPDQPKGGARKRSARKRAGGGSSGSASSGRSGDGDAGGGAGGSRGDAGRGSSSRGGSSRGGSNRGGANRGGSGRGGANRGGANRGGSNRGGSNRGGADRGSAGERPDDSPEVQPKGRQARGEGQPQLARRVQVEHLP